MNKQLSIEELKKMRVHAASLCHDSYVSALDELIAIRELKGSVGYAKDWEIDRSAGVPILLYKKCSVIESEQAYGLLNLIKQSELKGDQCGTQSRMTLSDAIQHADDVAGNGDDCAAQHAQLAAWLRELQALKGDQVPVAFTAARWLDTRCKLSVWTDRESAVMEIGDNSKVAELYDRPQKPVVLPETYEPRVGGNYEIELVGVPNGEVYLVSDVKAAIEAAGGIVKDGE